MPLLPIILEQGFLDIIVNPPKSPIETANKISKTYADYTRLAIAGASGPAVFTGAEASKMANVMAGGFNPLGAAPAASGGIIQGILAFWLSPPVPFAAGVTVSWAGPPVLGSCLASSFVNPKVPAAVAAKKLANCFDAASRLVFVQSIAPGPPVPIS